jgi:hypothetical protein
LCGVFTLVRIGEDLVLVTTPHVAAQHLSRDAAFVWIDLPSLPIPLGRMPEARIRPIDPSELGMDRFEPGWRRAGESEVVYTKIRPRDPVLRSEFLARAMLLDDLSPDVPPAGTDVAYVYGFSWSETSATGDWWVISPGTTVAGEPSNLLVTDKNGRPAAPGDSSGKPRASFPIANDSDRIVRGMSGAPIILRSASGAPPFVGVLYGNVWDGDPADPAARVRFTLVAPVNELRLVLESESRKRPGN